MNYHLGDPVNESKREIHMEEWINGNKYRGQEYKEMEKQGRLWVKERQRADRTECVWEKSVPSKPRESHFRCLTLCGRLSETFSYVKLNFNMMTSDSYIFTKSSILYTIVLGFFDHELLLVKGNSEKIFPFVPGRHARCCRSWQPLCLQCKIVNSCQQGTCRLSKDKCQSVLEVSGGCWSIREPSYRKYFRWASAYSRKWTRGRRTTAFAYKLICRSSLIIVSLIFIIMAEPKSSLNTVLAYFYT